MILAVLLTAAALVIGTTGVLLTDCSSSALNMFGGDPAQLCASVTELGINPEPWMGLGLLTVAILGLVAAWAPTKRRRAQREDLRSISALQRNLDRVRESNQPEPADDTPSLEVDMTGDDEFTALSGLIDDLRVGFESDDASREDLMETWIATLRICNDLHNSGELETADFKQLNTGLLELVTPNLAVEPTRSATSV